MILHQKKLTVFKSLSQQFGLMYSGNQAWHSSLLDFNPNRSTKNCLNALGDTVLFHKDEF